MDNWEQHDRQLIKTYERAAEISGFSPEELYDGKCLALVTDVNSKYYRIIGVVEANFSRDRKNVYIVKLKGKGKKPRKVRFEGEYFPTGLRNKLSCALNLGLLLEERDKLPSLFHD